MKLLNILTAVALTATLASSNDVMKKSMSLMELGMTQIQQGFLNNSIDLIQSGTKLVKDGNALFSDEKIISQYLPENKKHMSSIAAKLAKRIDLDTTVLELNLEEQSIY